MLESDCKADPCTQADDGALCCEDMSGSTSGMTYGDCTADQVTEMQSCSDKITADSEAMADMDKLCGIYQSINACVPACICENETWAALMAESNKQNKESLAKLDIECELKCGVNSGLSAANPLTIGFTSVALIVAALFATL